MRKVAILEPIVDQETMLEISKTTQALLHKDNHITISEHKAIPTIVKKYLDSVVDYVVNSRGEDANETTLVDVFGLFEIGSFLSVEEEGGDASANFSPVCEIGEVALQMLEDSKE